MGKPANTATAHYRPEGKEKKDYRLLLYIAPFLLLVILFAYVPLSGWLLAFMDYVPGVPLSETPFVGLKIFDLVFQDRANLLRVVKNTVIFALLGYLVAPLPMLFAIALNEVKNSRLKRVVQTVTTFPNFVSWIIVFALAFQFFSFDGMVSNLLIQLRIQTEPTSLLASADAVYPFQTTLSVWKSMGWNSVIYLAAITGIEQELYEAASIDGAGRIQRIWHITIPLILPTFTVLMLLQISSFVGVGLDQYLAFFNGIVADKIEVIDLYVYRMGLLRRDYSFGTVIGIMKSVISIVMMFGINGLSKKIRGHSIV